MANILKKQLETIRRSEFFTPFKRSALFLVIAKYLLIATIFIIIALAAIELITKEISKTTKNIAEAKRLSRSLTQRSVEKIELEALFAKIGDNDKRMETAIIPIDNAIEFVSYIEGLASRHSMTQSIKFGTPNDTDYGNNIRRVDFSIVLNGTASTLSKFLSDLEHAPYFAYIRSGQLSGRNANGWADSSTINLQGSLYVR